MDKSEFRHEFHDHENFKGDLLFKMCDGLEESSIRQPRPALQEELSEPTITSNLQIKNDGSETNIKIHQTLFRTGDKARKSSSQGIDVGPQCKDAEEYPTIDRKLDGTKRRRRVPDIHNQKERVRRERINERIRILHTLIPNSNKGDKVCMLDDAIQYIKSLQHHAQTISEWRRIHTNSSSATPQHSLEYLQTFPIAQNLYGGSFGYGVHGMSCNCYFCYQTLPSQGFVSSAQAVSLPPLPMPFSPSTHSTVWMNTGNLYPSHLFHHDSSTLAEPSDS